MLSAWNASENGPIDLPSSTTTVKPRNSKALAQKVNEDTGKAELRLYPEVTHSGIIMAIARQFRSKAPVIDDVLAFTRQQAK